MVLLPNDIQSQSRKKIVLRASSSWSTCSPPTPAESATIFNVYKRKITWRRIRHGDMQYRLSRARAPLHSFALGWRNHIVGNSENSRIKSMGHKRHRDDSTLLTEGSTSEELYLRSKLRRLERKVKKGRRQRYRKGRRRGRRHDRRGYSSLDDSSFDDSSSSSTSKCNL